MARHYKKCSEFGRRFDLIADTIFTITITISFVYSIITYSNMEMYYRYVTAAALCIFTTIMSFDEVPIIWTGKENYDNEFSKLVHDNSCLFFVSLTAAMLHLDGSFDNGLMSQ
jgi:hypothetical protein